MQSVYLHTPILLQANLLSLPEDVTIIFFSYFTEQELDHNSLVCKIFKELTLKTVKKEQLLLLRNLAIALIKNLDSGKIQMCANLRALDRIITDAVHLNFIQKALEFFKEYKDFYDKSFPEIYCGRINTLIPHLLGKGELAAAKELLNTIEAPPYAEQKEHLDNLIACYETWMEKTDIELSNKLKELACAFEKAEEYGKKSTFQSILAIALLMAHRDCLNLIYEAVKRTDLKSHTANMIFFFLTDCDINILTEECDTKWVEPQTLINAFQKFCTFLFKKGIIKKSISIAEVLDRQYGYPCLFENQMNEYLEFYKDY